MNKAGLEQSFLTHWRLLFPSLPAPEMQHAFAMPARRWRFDFAWVQEKLAVEIDGGAFIGGAHNRGSGQAKDYEKQNAAVSLGWRVLRFNTDSMKRPVEVVEFVAAVLTNAKDIE